ncbi:MAG: hypothetical protein ABFS56_24490 [Pseudomonadota bacterium]
MLQTIEAVLNPDGKIHLLETVKLTSPHKVLVTVLSEPTELPKFYIDFKTALLAMPNVGEDTDFEIEPDEG